MERILWGSYSHIIDRLSKRSLRLPLTIRLDKPNTFSTNKKDAEEKKEETEEENRKRWRRRRNRRKKKEERGRRGKKPILIK